MRNKKQRGNGALYGSLILIQCLIWGIGNPLTKIGLQTITPYYCLALRFTLAFLLFAAVFGKRIWPQLAFVPRKDCLRACFFSGAAFICCNVALALTTATSVGFLMSLSVIFTPFIARAVLKERMAGKHLFIVVAVTLGLYLLCSEKGAFRFGAGELLALLCALSLACSLIFSQRCLAWVDAVTVSTLQSGFTAAAGWAFALVFEDFSGLAGVSPAGWAVVAYLAVACTCVAYILQNIALSHVSSSFVALMLCTQPVFTAAASYFILGEGLTARGLAGAAVVVGCIVKASMPEKERMGRPPSQGAAVGAGADGMMGGAVDGAGADGMMGGAVDGAADGAADKVAGRETTGKES